MRYPPLQFDAILLIRIHEQVSPNTLDDLAPDVFDDPTGLRCICVKSHPEPKDPDMSMNPAEGPNSAWILFHCAMIQYLYPRWYSYPSLGLSMHCVTHHAVFGEGDIEGGAFRIARYVFWDSWRSPMLRLREYPQRDCWIHFCLVGLLRDDFGDTGEVIAWSNYRENELMVGITYPLDELQRPASDLEVAPG